MEFVGMPLHQLISSFPVLVMLQLEMDRESLLEIFVVLTGMMA